MLNNINSCFDTDIQVQAGASSVVNCNDDSACEASNFIVDGSLEINCNHPLESCDLINADCNEGSICTVNSNYTFNGASINCYPSATCDCGSNPQVCNSG